MKGIIVEEPSGRIGIMLFLFPGLQEMKSVAEISQYFH